MTVPTKQELLYDCGLEHLEVGPDGNVILAPNLKLVFRDEDVMLCVNDHTDYFVHCADDLVDLLAELSEELDDHISGLEDELRHIEQARKVVLNKRRA